MASAVPAEAKARHGMGAGLLLLLLLLLLLAFANPAQAIHEMPLALVSGEAACQVFGRGAGTQPVELTQFDCEAVGCCHWDQATNDGKGACWSSVGVERCAGCPPGQVATPQAGCFSCPENTFAARGESACFSCPAGTHTQGKTGETSAAACVPHTLDPAGFPRHQDLGKGASVRWFVPLDMPCIAMPATHAVAK